MAASTARIGARLGRLVIRWPVAGPSRTICSTPSRSEITKFAMPAMSPTMTEGGLAAWKVKEGQSFAAGDVLLEIETDKATMDVEAQEDGIMAKIIVEAGAKGVPVGKAIAMLAEEGDDIANVEVPKEDDQPAQAKQEPKEQASEKQASQSSSSSSEKKVSTATKQDEQVHQTPATHHAPDLGRTLFPSVSRLLLENNVSQQDAQKIKGTGIRGMLTKGDVLSFLGQASSPLGSYKEGAQGVAAQGGAATAGTKGAGPKKVQEPLTSDAVRTLIFAGLAGASHASRARAAASQSLPSHASISDGQSGSRQRRTPFDELLDDYEFQAARKSSSGKAPSKSSDVFAGII